MFCRSCAFPLEGEDLFCRRCGRVTPEGEKVEVRVVPRLRRSYSDKRLGGVCGGVARYLDQDPKMVRAVWAGVSLLPFSPGVFVYGIAWVVLSQEGSEEPSPLSRLARRLIPPPPSSDSTGSSVVH